jgi:hypothetical protein
MIFKYFKGQIYLIIYLILRKLKSKTPCCLHYFGDGILGCYKPRLRLGRGKLDNYSGRLRQAQTTRSKSSVPEWTVIPGHAAAPTTNRHNSSSTRLDRQWRTTGRTSNQALYLFLTSLLCPSSCDYKRERRAIVTRVRISIAQTPYQWTWAPFPLPTSL